MTLDAIISKVVLPLTVAVVISSAGLVITVYIMESTQKEIKKQNTKQWEYISDNLIMGVRNEEKIKALRGQCVNTAARTIK